MQELLDALLGAYDRAEVREHAMGLMNRGSQSRDLVMPYLDCRCSAWCLLKLGQHQNRLSPEHLARFDQFLRDRQLRRDLADFLADVSKQEEPDAALTCLLRHQATIQALTRHSEAILLTDQ